MATSALRVVAAFVLVATSALLFIALALLLLPSRVARIKLCNIYGKTVGRAVVALSGARPVVEHGERLASSFPAIYVANHASTLDAFLSIWLCPIGGCGVMKREVVRIPFFGWLYLLSGHLLIDRGDRSRAIGALDEMAALVRRRGLGIWIMPEGTRSPDGRLGRFKPGFVHLAIATGLPVVPVVYAGAHLVWPARGLRLVPGPVTTTVLPRIDTRGWQRETAQAHADEVRAFIAGALPPDQQPVT
jgi:1-acyl-sn-glycerol-3-phosphate acyltransferase